MGNPKIGVIIGSVREGRFADRAASWLRTQTALRDDMDFEFLDLKDYPMPFYNEPKSPASGEEAQNEMAQEWRRKLRDLDGFVFITAEYNHGPPASLKNALDWAYYEWNHKPVAFMGYGNMGASRAIEHLRGVIDELEMVSVRPTVQIGGSDMSRLWKGGELDDLDFLPGNAKKMFDELAFWVRLTRDGRTREGK